MPDLETQLKAVVMAHTEANKWTKILLEFFKPYVGKQIFNRGGELKAVIAKELPKMPYETIGIRMVNRSHTQGLVWSVEAGIEAGIENHGFHRHCVHIYIGEIDNLILKGLNENPHHYRTDYDLDHIRSLQVQLKAADQQVRELKSEIFPFPES